MVDALLCPLAECTTELLMLDAVLHGIIERNPPEPAVKFIQQNRVCYLKLFMRFANRGQRLSSDSGKISFLAVKAPKTSTIQDSGNESAHVKRPRKEREPLKVTQPRNLPKLLPRLIRSSKTT